MLKTQKIFNPQDQVKANNHLLILNQKKESHVLEEGHQLSKRDWFEKKFPSDGKYCRSYKYAKFKQSNNTNIKLHQHLRQNIKKPKFGINNLTLARDESKNQSLLAPSDIPKNLDRKCIHSGVIQGDIKVDDVDQMRNSDDKNLGKQQNVQLTQIFGCQNRLRYKQILKYFGYRNTKNMDFSAKKVGSKRIQKKRWKQLKQGITLQKESRTQNYNVMNTKNEEILLDQFIKKNKQLNQNQNKFNTHNQQQTKEVVCPKTIEVCINSDTQSELDNQNDDFCHNEDYDQLIDCSWQEDNQLSEDQNQLSLSPNAKKSEGQLRLENEVGRASFLGSLDDSDEVHSANPSNLKQRIEQLTRDIVDIRERMQIQIERKLGSLKQNNDEQLDQNNQSNQSNQSANQIQSDHHNQDDFSCRESISIPLKQKHEIQELEKAFRRELTQPTTQGSHTSVKSSTKDELIGFCDQTYIINPSSVKSEIQQGLEGMSSEHLDNEVLINQSENDNQYIELKLLMDKTEKSPNPKNLHLHISETNFNTNLQLSCSKGSIKNSIDQNKSPGSQK